MKVPIRIFYDKQTGQVIQITGDFEDKWLTDYETIEEQIPKYKTLSERNRETFDVIELPYGSYEQDFRECNGYRVNPETKELEFSYPDPNEEETQEPVYQKPLSEQINELEDKTDQAIMELTMILAMGGMG